MRLHENKELYRDAILATSQHFEIPEIYIEKDYWVTAALYKIFHSDMANEVVFKGGTALSKCHKLIERFSEDIDVVVFKHEGENDNQLKKKIRKAGKLVEAIMPEVNIPEITNKRGNIRKTVHQYHKIFEGNFGQVREHIIFEATWLGSFQPYTTESIDSYVAEMMKATNRFEIIDEYNLNAFKLKVLAKERTLCEKIMSLVRFSQQDNPIEDLSNKIRHIYDIFMMLQNHEISMFFRSNEFDKMMIKVGNDDIISFKNNNKWLVNHPAEALIFKYPSETWEQIKAPYRTTFSELVTGVLPNEKNLVKTLSIIHERLQKIDWKIKLNQEGELF